MSPRPRASSPVMPLGTSEARVRAGTRWAPLKARFCAEFTYMYANSAAREPIRSDRTRVAVRRVVTAVLIGRLARNSSGFRKKSRRSPDTSLVKRGRCRGERGTAMVEFALIVPFLALLTFATIDLGRVYTLQHRLANAAREGAAYAQNYPGQISNSGTCADPSNITYHALNEDRGSTSGFTVTVTNVTTGATVAGPCLASGSIAPGTKLKVTVAGTFTPLTFLARQFIGSPATIKQSTQIVVQG